MGSRLLHSHPSARCVACSFIPRLPTWYVSSFTARLLADNSASASTDSGLRNLVALWLARYDFYGWPANNAFMFFTAASSPMNNDSAMMAWPMLSSTRLGIATIGCTLW